MFYAEMDFYGISGIPHISTMYYIDSSKWDAWRVRLTDKNIELHTDSKVDIISLKQIEFVDRPLSHAVANKIQKYTKHGSFLVIDYKEKATIGHGNVLFSLVLAGKKEDVSTLKHLLMSLLGLSADPVAGRLRPEEIRLLLLFAAGMNTAEVVLPLFNNDAALLQRTFIDLIKKGMVDEYASLTTSGKEVVEKVKGSGKTKLGSEVDSKFDELSRNWICMEEHSAIPMLNKILWKHGSSSLNGLVTTEDIWNYITIGHIRIAELKKMQGAGLGLLMHTYDGATIFLLSCDSSVVLALYGILNKEEDRQIRVLFTFYLGYESEKNVLAYMGLSEYEFDDHCEQMMRKGLLDEHCRCITQKGLNLLYKKLIGDASVLLEHDSSEERLEKFDRLDRMKRSSAKKRVLQALQDKHMQLDAPV